MSRVVSGGRGPAVPSVPEQAVARQTPTETFEEILAEAETLVEQSAMPEESRAKLRQALAEAGRIAAQAPVSGESVEQLEKVLAEALQIAGPPEEVTAEPKLGTLSAARAADQMDQPAKPLLSMGDSVSGTIFGSFEPFETEAAASAPPAAATQAAPAATAPPGDANEWAKRLRESLSRGLTLTPAKPESESIEVGTSRDEADAIRWYQQATADSKRDLVLADLLAASPGEQFEDAARVFVRDAGASSSSIESLRQMHWCIEGNYRSDPPSRRILSSVDNLSAAKTPGEWEASLRLLADTCEEVVGRNEACVVKQKAENCIEPIRRDLQSLEFMRRLAATLNDASASPALPLWAASKHDGPAQKALGRLATAAEACAQAAQVASASRSPGYEPSLPSEAAALKSARAHGVPEEKFKQVLRMWRTAVPAEPERPGRLAMPETRQRYQVALAAREVAVAQSNLDGLLNRLALEADPAECRRKVRREVRQMGASVPSLHRLAQDAGLDRLGEKSEQAKVLINILLDPSQPDEMWEAALGQLRPLVEDDWNLKTEWLALTYDQVALDALPKLFAAAADRKQRAEVLADWGRAAVPVSKESVTDPGRLKTPLNLSLLEAARRLHKALSSLEPASAAGASEG